LKHLLSLFFTLLLLQGISQDVEKISKILKKNGISEKDFGLSVRSGEANFGINERKSFAPASNLKLITTGLALQEFGANHRFKTSLQYSGSIRDSVLYGNIIVIGGGDPTTGSKYFDNRGFLKTWIQEVQKIGVKRVEGAVLCDASYFDYNYVPDSWEENDVGNYFGAGSAGLNVYDNLFEIYFKTGKEGSPADIDSFWPKIDYIKIFGEVLAAKSNSDNCYIYGGPYVYQRKLTGSIPEDRSSFLVKGSLPDPAFHLATEFQRELALAGIRFTQAAQTKRVAELSGLWGEKAESREFKSFEGAALSEIVRWTNMKSVNLFAENLFLHLAKKNATPDYPAARKWMQNKLTEFEVQDTAIILDGSGLSRGNRMTPFTMTSFLELMNAEESFKKSLPLAGVSGSIQNSFSSLNGLMWAKSGSYTGVRAYSGYLKCESAKEPSFMIVINGDYSHGTMKTAIEQILSEVQKEF